MTFSVITVCYNSERTVERTIKSVLNQSFADYEYIIVDGGSKDGTINIVKRYVMQFKGKLKWKSEPDDGIYDAMNKGIRMATGDIIGIVNSDDWLENVALERVYAAYQENGCSNDDIYTGGMVFHRKNGKAITLHPNRRALKCYAVFGDLGGIRHPATYVPKNVYEKIGLFDTRMKVSADADFLLRFYKSNRGGVFSHR